MYQTLSNIKQSNDSWFKLKKFWSHTSVSDKHSFRSTDGSCVKSRVERPREEKHPPSHWELCTRSQSCRPHLRVETGLHHTGTLSLKDRVLESKDYTLRSYYYGVSWQLPVSTWERRPIFLDQCRTRHPSPSPCTLTSPPSLWMKREKRKNIRE